MRRNRQIVIPILVAAVAITASILGVRTFMSRGSQDRLAAREDVGITALRAPLPPPSFLACPLYYCNAEAGLIVPVFSLPWQALREKWVRMIAGQPHVVPLGEALEGRRLTYIQHSVLFRFPDAVTVEFVSLGPDRSSLALYSRSRYGRFDFRQNRKRVEAWLADLKKLAIPIPTQSGRSN
jgi:uncharacterized protein (DUF1499 family)